MPISKKRQNLIENVPNVSLLHLRLRCSALPRDTSSFPSSGSSFILSFLTSWNPRVSAWNVFNDNFVFIAPLLSELTVYSTRFGLNRQTMPTWVAINCVLAYSFSYLSCLDKDKTFKFLSMFYNGHQLCQVLLCVAYYVNILCLMRSTYSEILIWKGGCGKRVCLMRSGRHSLFGIKFLRPNAGETLIVCLLRIYAYSES